MKKLCPVNGCGLPVHVHSVDGPVVTFTCKKHGARLRADMSAFPKLARDVSPYAGLPSRTELLSLRKTVAGRKLVYTYLRRIADRLAADFSAAHLRYWPGATVYKAELYAEFRTWMVDNYYRGCVSSAAFGAALKRLGYRDDPNSKYFLNTTWREDVNTAHVSR